jgi:DNA-binding transcriptional LysR family regulator
MNQLHTIDLKLLRVFETIVKHGGFAAAQAVLNIGQSTISEYVSQLEGRLGVRLCERGRGGFRLTEQGEALYLSSKRLLVALDDFRSDAELIRRKLGGWLNLGLIDNTISDTRSPVAGAIRRFSDRCQDVYLNVQIGTPAELEKAVLEGTLHLAVGHFHAHVPGLLYRPLYAEEQGLYGSPQAAGLYPTLEALRAALPSLKVVARSYMRRGDLEALGVTEAAALVANVEAQALLILSGNYLGFLPSHYAQRWVESGALQRLFPEQIAVDTTFEIVMRRGQDHSLLVETILDDLQIELAALAG